MAHLVSANLFQTAGSYLSEMIDEKPLPKSPLPEGEGQGEGFFIGTNLCVPLHPAVNEIDYASVRTQFPEDPEK